MFSALGRRSLTWSIVKTVLREHRARESTSSVTALRSKKPRGTGHTTQHFVDECAVRTVGGNGGDGCISFLRLWANPNAGPDGGDGGNGGHVVFQASSNVKGLEHLYPVLKGDNGEKGYNKDCHGKNADHTVIQVPLGTVVKAANGKVVADLHTDGMMFIAARGGAGGKGNHFFMTDTEQAPEIAEYGASGEDLKYFIEVRSMAHLGLIGLPNAGKSTLLRAISRARPKVAPYPFTTLRPHIGIVQYTDYEQVAVADLPGLIPESHKNKGLGIAFLRHAERCLGLLIIVDMGQREPWEQVECLEYELQQFSAELASRPKAIIANKMDLQEAKDNLPLLEAKVNLPVIPISAKIGTNVSVLLEYMRNVYDEHLKTQDQENSESGNV